MKDITNELEHKKPKPNEALQLLLQLRPDLNSQKIYFFPCTNVHEEGILLYDQKDNLYYVHDILSGKKFYTFFSWISFLRDSKKLYKGNRSPLVTIFLKPDPFSANISSILREKEQKYFKRKEILSVKEFQTRIQQRVHENSLYASVIIKEISGGVELMEIKYNDTIKRKLIIEWKDTILVHKIVIGKDFGMDKLTFQTIEEIENIIDNFFQMKICEGFLTKGINVLSYVINYLNVISN